MHQFGGIQEELQILLSIHLAQFLKYVKNYFYKYVK